VQKCIEKENTVHKPGAYRVVVEFFGAAVAVVEVREVGVAVAAAAVHIAHVPETAAASAAHHSCQTSLCELTFRLGLQGLCFVVWCILQHPRRFLVLVLLTAT
jgi:hypothetical protein